MYSPKIDENQIKRLYHFREHLKSQGHNVTMIGMVREAMAKYLDENESKKKRGTKNKNIVK